mgnify:FL=1
MYNFQVEDFHTYHVGENCVLVHNADYDVDIVSKNIKERISNDELNPPTKRGNAPTSKKDGKPIEIHHDNQNPNDHFMKKIKLIIDWVVIIKKITLTIMKEVKLIVLNGVSKRKIIGKMSGIREGGNK